MCHSKVRAECLCVYRCVFVVAVVVVVCGGLEGDMWVAAVGRRVK